MVQIIEQKEKDTDLREQGRILADALQHKVEIVESRVEVVKSRVEGLGCRDSIRI